jgi:hypothetical protein
LKTLAKLFTFVNNEEYLLRYWLPYHARFFGYKNIFVIDQNSTDNTEKICKQYIKEGLNYSRAKTRFSAKSKMLSRLMSVNKKESKFLFALDADEFLVYYENGNIIVDEATINNKLQKLLDANRYQLTELRALSKKVNYDNSLLEINEFFHCNMAKLKKVFYPGKFFISTDQGNHRGRVSNRSSIHQSNFSYLHFNYRSYQHFVDKVKKGIGAYNYDINSKPKSGKHWMSAYKEILAGRGEKYYRKIYNKKGIVYKDFSTLIKNYE